MIEYTLKFIIRNLPHKVTFFLSVALGGFVECTVFFSEMDCFRGIGCESIIYLVCIGLLRRRDETRLYQTIILTFQLPLLRYFFEELIQTFTIQLITSIFNDF